MFTGIVQAVGAVTSLKQRGGGARIAIAAPAGVVRGLKRGDSIAVNGCCLTILAKKAKDGRIGFSADLTPETLAKTNLGQLGRGARVNLEAPLRAGDTISGHWLQGHVEGTGKLISLEPAGEDGGHWMEIDVPEGLRRRLAEKGSLAVEGISLTIAAIHGGRLGFAIIPHTYRATNLRRLKPGDRVNLETDMIARHLEQLLEARR
jgi:riboflavin synthase